MSQSPRCPSRSVAFAASGSPRSPIVFAKAEPHEPFFSQYPLLRWLACKVSASPAVQPTATLSHFPRLQKSSFPCFGASLKHSPSPLPATDAKRNCLNGFGLSKKQNKQKNPQSKVCLKPSPFLLCHKSPKTKTEKAWSLAGYLKEGKGKKRGGNVNNRFKERVLPAQH